MTPNDSVDLEDARELMRWAKGTSIRHLRVRVGDRLLEIRNEQLAMVAEGEGVHPTAPSLQVRSPAAGRFSQVLEAGAPVESRTVIGTIRLVRTSRPVVAGATGRLASFAADNGKPVEYGEVLALLTLKEATP